MKPALSFLLVAALLVGCAAALDPVEQDITVKAVETIWQYGPTIYAVKIRDGDRVCYVPANGSGIACFEEASWAP